MKTRYAFGIPIAVSLALGGAGAAAYAANHHHVTVKVNGPICYVEQPVYTSTPPYVRAGSMVAWLRPGQRLVLPNGDTAGCDNGQVTIS